MRVTKYGTLCTYKRKTETRSLWHFCRRKAVNITFSECVSVALVIQHALRMRHITLSSVACLATMFFHTISKKPRLSENNCRTWNVCLDWSKYYRKCTWDFMQSTRYSYHILIKIVFSRQIFEKQSSIKFHEHPFFGSRVVPCGRTDRETKRSS